MPRSHLGTSSTDDTFAGNGAGVAVTATGTKVIGHPPADPWQVDRLDLDGYLDRLGVRMRQPSRIVADLLEHAAANASTVVGRELSTA
jgi:hypothetical protein